MAELTAKTSSTRRRVGMQKAIDDDIAGRPTYPSGTSFIHTDINGFGEWVAREASRRRPIVLVYPDGEEVFLVPTPHPADAA
jgi:hypothetical protein